MQRQAILSRHEDTREALAQIGARGGVAARFREVAFPMASVKEHQSRTETFARVSHLVVSVVDDDPQPFPRRRDYASMDGNGAGLTSIFCGPLASTLADGSVGFSTRRDDPSN